MVIIKNAIRCNRCGDEIESTDTPCSCGTCSVDGGHEYLRRCAPSEKDFTDISIVETEKRRRQRVFEVVVSFCFEKLVPFLAPCVVPRVQDLL